MNSRVRLKVGDGMEGVQGGEDEGEEEVEEEEEEEVFVEDDEAPMKAALLELVRGDWVAIKAAALPASCSSRSLAAYGLVRLSSSPVISPSGISLGGECYGVIQGISQRLGHIPISLQVNPMPGTGVNESKIALPSAEEHVVMTGLSLKEVKQLGRKPSNASRKEAAALILFQNFKLSLVEHEEILAIAASLSPELRIGEEEEEEEEEDAMQVGFEEASGQLASRAPSAVAPVQLRSNPYAAAPLMPTAAAMRQSRPLPGQGTLTCLNAPIAAPLHQAVSRHQAYFDGEDFSEDELMS